MSTLQSCRMNVFSSFLPQELKNANLNGKHIIQIQYGKCDIIQYREQYV